MSERPDSLGGVPPKDVTGQDQGWPHSIPQPVDPGHRVLIVEDDVELGVILRTILARMGFEAWHAADGQQALELYASEKPDLVLLDIALPDITGWRLLEEMRERPHGGANPAFLVITAYGDPANRLMGKLQGVQGYLIKPFKVEEIGRAVMSALQLHA
ncbi:MAG: response regulator [Anaerolineae bacterium]|nr:response regulator [Anaerolineae bacterium]